MGSARKPGGMKQTVTNTAEVVALSPKQMDAIPLWARETTGRATYLMIGNLHAAEDLGGRLPAPIDRREQLFVDMPSRND
jgi:hypothetical protein